MKKNLNKEFLFFFKNEDVLKLFLNIKKNKDKGLLELLKGSLIGFSLKILGLALGYVFFLMVAKKYGAEGVGVLTLSITYLLIGTTLAKVGIDIGFMKMIARIDGNNLPAIKGLYVNSLLLLILFTILIVLIFVIASKMVASFVFSKSYLEEAFTLGAIMVLPLALNHFHSEAFRGYKKVAFYFLFNSVLVFLTAILLMFFNITPGFSRYPYVDIYLCAQVLVAFLSIICWLKVTKIYQVQKERSLSSSAILSASFPIMITASVSFLMGWMDIIMLGIFRTEAEVGVYAMALKVAMLTSIALIAVNGIVAPKISSFFGKNDYEGIKKIIGQSTAIVFYSSLPILIVCLIFPEFVMKLFGEEFIAGAFALMMLSIGQFIHAMSGPVGNILNMTDKQKILRNITLVAALLNFVLNYLLIPLYGINGAAIATAVSWIAWNMLCVFYVYKYFGILVIYCPQRFKK